MFASVKTADGIEVQLEGEWHEVNSVLGGYAVSDLVDQVHTNEVNSAITVIEAVFGEVQKINELTFHTPTDRELEDELDAAAEEASELVNAGDVKNLDALNDAVWDDGDEYGYGHWPY